MTKRRNILLGGGIAAAVPLVSTSAPAAADTQVGGGSDEQRIYQLLLRYCRAVDTRDEAALAAVFLPNARLTYDLFAQRDFTSAAEFAHYVINGLSGIAATQHYLSNVDISVSGAEADSLSYIYAPSIRKNGTYILVGGQYRDELQKIRSEWRIARRRFEVLWTLSGDV